MPAPDPDPVSTFAIVPITDGQRVPADAIAHGSGNLVREFLAGSAAAEAAIARASEREAAANADYEARLNEGLAGFMDKITGLARRLDRLERAKARRRELDIETEAARDLLELPRNAPDPDVPSVPADDNLGAASGLTVIPPSEGPFNLPPPPGIAEGDAAGDLPRTSPVRCRWDR